jgi:hypothetical protein
MPEVGRKNVISKCQIAKTGLLRRTLLRPDQAWWLNKGVDLVSWFLCSIITVVELTVSQC